MEKQPKELNRPLGEEVHITYPEEAGIVTTLAGMGEQGRKNGPGATATFNRPQGIAITPWTPRTIRYGVCGVVYVADTMNHMIRAIDREGNVTTYAGDGRPGYVDGGCAVARFHEPCGITVNSDGDIFVVDRVNHCVRMIEMKTKKVSTFVGAPVPGCVSLFLLLRSWPRTHFAPFPSLLSLPRSFFFSYVALVQIF